MKILTKPKTMILVLLVSALALSLSYFFVVYYVFAASADSMDFERDDTEYISVSDANQENLDDMENLTIEAWVKPESSHGASEVRSIAGKWGSSDQAYLLYYSSDSGSNTNIRLAIDTDLSAGDEGHDVTLSTSVWTHVAAVYRAADDEIEFYINGSSVETDAIGSNNDDINNNGADFIIGSDAEDTSRSWDGLIDEVRVWSTARTDAEISANYNKELTGTETGLEGYWRLNDDDQRNRTYNTISNLGMTGTPVYSGTSPSITAASAGLVGFKDPSQSITSDATLSTDVNLRATDLEANKKYVIHGTLFVSAAHNTPNLTLGFRVPEDAELNLGYVATQGTNLKSSEFLNYTGVSGGSVATSSSIDIPGSGTVFITYEGTLDMGANAGDLDIQWSQNVSNANTTTLKKGSYIWAEVLE